MPSVARVEVVDPTTTLPEGLDLRSLARRAAQVALILGLLVLVALLAPGLGDVRKHLGAADPWWVALAVGLELLSCLSYVLMFRPIFCRRMSWAMSSKISWSSLGVGSIVPASGAAGLALGGWALTQGGMSIERVARRSVAFFTIKSSVNFIAVAVIGTLMALGLFGPDVSLWLTAVPAAMSVATIAIVLALPKLGDGGAIPEDAGKVRRFFGHARASVIHGVHEATEIVKTRDLLVLVGAIGYWAWDNAVLWAAFQAFDADVAVSVILMGYLIGQLGGLLPIPGGVGGIDGGLIGTLIVFGAPAAVTVAAVLVYRVILFWLPLAGGSIGFVALTRALRRGDEVCSP
ncbi:MAG: flippase-like domain-containing protein [Solirubrobacteraceae bacterium]|nr:flippase-like domain-containing protein [Solirubrobacteraceae bacterium]